MGSCRWTIAAGCVALVLCSGAAWAVDVRIVDAVTLTFYDAGDSDSSGLIGLKNWTTEQIDDAVACATTWTSRISDAAGRQVDVHFFWHEYSGNILGGSSNPFESAGGNAYTFSEYVWREGVNFTRPFGVDYDAVITYDNDAAGYAWNFGSDAPNGSEIDFRSVVAHELGHSLGFEGTYDNNTDKWWSGGISAWDSYLRDDAGNAPAPNSKGTPHNFVQTDNPVWFTGPVAEAEYGGAVPVYAPAAFANGSSLYHLDDTGGLIDDLMSHSIGLGQTARMPTDLDWAVMQDLGWTLAPVPEPATIALFATGLTALAAFRRLRRNIEIRNSKSETNIQ